MYEELAELRQRMNAVQHVEPTGQETFGDAATSNPERSVIGTSRGGFDDYPE
jgi:hypothetical protein